MMEQVVNKMLECEVGAVPSAEPPSGLGSILMLLHSSGPVALLTS